LAVFRTIVNLKAPNPQKERVSIGTQLLTKTATCGLAEERKTNKKGGRRKSQNRYISPPRGGAISQPIFTKFGDFIDHTNIITPAKFG